MKSDPRSVFKARSFKNTGRVFPANHYT
uniref:Uncharacterized protein n=1 Tax=Anguilla anguilla TaxID=7936 RepID=A0A0E9XK70_ANGAN